MKRINPLSFVAMSTLILFSVMNMSCGRKPSVEIVEPEIKQTTPKQKPVVKVFLENSGSMDGFMCAGSELKDDIYNYLSYVKDYSSKMELYYINSEVKKQTDQLSQYIHNLNPAAFKAAGGNRKFTNIPDLFRSVLDSVKSNTIAIYISDCILDIPNQAAPDYLHITQTDVHNVFGDKIKDLKDLSVCIYKLESTFQGTYFFPKGGSQQYKGKLPYYMFVIGSNSQLANLRKNVSDDKIKHGVKNYCAFSPAFESPATFMQGNKPTSSIELNTLRNGRFHFSVQTNLASSLQLDNVLTNVGNYTLTSNKIKIESIAPIMVENSDYSHVIEFSILDEAFGNVVTLKRIAMPDWVKDANNSKGNKVTSNQTFGIEYIISGISDAFTSKYSAKFKLNIKK